MTDRLKNFLFEILLKEEGEIQAEAWAHLKMLDLDCDDLSRVINEIPFVKTPYIDEGWELFKTKNPTKQDVIDIVKCSTKRQEAEAYLLEHFELENEDLVEVIKVTENDELARQLLTRNASNKALEAIMRYTNLKDEAAEELLKRSPDNDELYEIITNSNLKMEAWERLVQQGPTNEELSSIVKFTDLEELAWDYLLHQHPTNEELMDFVNDYSETGRKRKEAAQLLLERELGTEELVNLIREDQFADEAWERLKKKSPTCDDLFYLIWRGTVKTDEAAEWCLKLNPDKKMLWDILEYSDKKDEAALQLIQMPLELYELADLVLKSSSEPVLNLLSERVQFDRRNVHEAELIQKIAEKILNNPELLNVNHWHAGDTHCLGGWAITLHEQAQEIEKQFGSEIAASLLLPHYTRLFFADRETVLAELKNIV